MPLFIPVIAAAAGAGATGWLWWSSSKEEEPTFSSELFDTLKPILIILLILFGLRWLYKQGNTAKKS
jgi:hypothetical protein